MRRYARMVLDLAVFVGVMALLAIVLPAQSPLEYSLVAHLPPQHVWFEQSARTAIERVWDSVHVAQSERALCLTYTTVWGKWSVNYVVVAADTAHVVAATPYSVDSSCPPGTARLHVHTPNTCATVTGDGCVWGGVDAWQCEATVMDQLVLLDEHIAFGVVMCDRHALVPYYASTILNALPGRP